MTTFAVIERNSTKPFNPLLGETFEYCGPNFKFLAEQVSHHPPVTALHCVGDSGYQIYSCNRAKTKFTGKSLNVAQMHRYYVELAPHGEKYECSLPTVSANNLIIGTPYLDLFGPTTIKNLSRPGDTCIINFHPRGWSASSYYKLDGDVFRAGNKKESIYKFEGKWNEGASLINVKTGEKETIWKKNPYPDQWEYMYGFTRFMLQMNYFPKRLRNLVAPTDTRWRPDQRALENGDIPLATIEKNRLEEKQRAVRKYKEKLGIEHQSVYFDEWHNPEDESI